MTELVLVKPLPEIVRAVPPAVLPELVLKPPTPGRLTELYVYCEAPVGDEAPVGVMTWMFTVPGTMAGEVARITLSESTAYDAEVPPKVTAVAPVK
jgi:hypothetical protein